MFNGNNGCLLLYLSKRLAFVTMVPKETININPNMMGWVNDVLS